MSLLPIALLLAANSRILMNDTIQVPRAEWRYLDIALKEPSATVNCSFQVLSGNSEARVVWIARHELEKFRTAHASPVLAATVFGQAGKLRFYARDKGDFALVIENKPSSKEAITVIVKVWLDSPVQPVTLSFVRQILVICVSLTCFLCMIAYAGLKLRVLGP